LFRPLQANFSRIFSAKIAGIRSSIASLTQPFREFFPAWRPDFGFRQKISAACIVFFIEFFIEIPV